LRKHLLEESYEAISAIDSGDFTDMREEFGDLLLQIVLQSQIANEEGQFNINQVVQGISSKLVRRHPHVFGDLELDGVDGVLANWEKLKETERKDKGQHEKGLLDGIPAALPALSQAQEYQDRAARVGFDWPEIDGVLDKVKEEIQLKIIHPLTHPEIYKAYGKPIGGGILMYGPPGCGKTHLARATAGEIKAGFIAVGINDVLDMWLGRSERNLHELFEQARAHKPCVLFFDEVDALGASRSDMRHHAGRQLINQFLSEMDGVKTSNEGVLILAATNAPWHLDSAFRRPGRFDRILFVPPPDAPARAAILRLQCRGKPVEELDCDQVAKKSEGFSGADLKAVVDVAVEKKLRDAMNTGVPKPITTKDLTTAAGSLKPTTKEWFATARNYALYSNQGGIYDDILQYLKLA